MRSEAGNPASTLTCRPSLPGGSVGARTFLSFGRHDQDCDGASQQNHDFVGIFHICEFRKSSRNLDYTQTSRSRAAPLGRLSLAPWLSITRHGSRPGACARGGAVHGGRRLSLLDGDVRCSPDFLFVLYSAGHELPMSSKRANVHSRSSRRGHRRFSRFRQRDANPERMSAMPFLISTPAIPPSARRAQHCGRFDIAVGFPKADTAPGCQLVGGKLSLKPRCQSRMPAVTTPILGATPSPPLGHVCRRLR